MAKKDKKVYRVSWVFPTEESFHYRVLMTESDSKMFGSILQEFVDTNYIGWYEIEEEDEPFSRSRFFQILKENFRIRPRHWMPRGEE